MTKEVFKSLSPKAQWDIQVALRGPDCHNSETIKWFTTSVIRGQMKEVMRVGGTVNEDLNLIITPSSMSWKDLTLAQREVIQSLPHFMLWNYSHFFEHVMAASLHMGIPYTCVSGGVWKEAVEKRPRDAAELFMSDLITRGSPHLAEELKRHLSTGVI